MKNEYIVDLSNIADLNMFVYEVSNMLASDVDAIYQRQIIDAKSILGVVSIASHPIKMVINSNDKEEIEIFSRLCKKYEVK